MKKIKKGFSLIETMIAIVVMFLAIGSAGFIISSNIKIIEKNRNRLTAIYLSEECLELLRNERDSNWKQNLPAFKSFDEENAEYRISKKENINFSDPQEQEIVIEKNPISFELKKNGPWITHEDGVPINFERKIFISEIKKEISKNGIEKISEILFTCEVSWKEKKSTDSLALSLLLTDWKK